MTIPLAPFTASRTVSGSVMLPLTELVPAGEPPTCRERIVTAALCFRAASTAALPNQPEPPMTMIFCPATSTIFTPPGYTGLLDRWAGRSLLSEFAVPVGGSHTAIHKNVAAGDEPAVRAHEQRADGSHLVWSARASSRRCLDHTAISFAARPGQFVLG